MNFYLNTCVFPRSHLEAGKIYRDRFGPSLGFELLMMFDLPDFEENLKQNLDLLAGGPVRFHEPVFGVEHSAPRGSAAWEEGMYHLRLTQKYARILHPSVMVFHLSNRIIPPGDPEPLLRTALENLEEVRDMFPDTTVVVENTGIRNDRTLLLDQQAFTGLCLSLQLPVIIDVGHANANGWNLRKLISDLAPRIQSFHLHNNDGVHDLHNRLWDGTVDFASLVPYINRITPDADQVIEYTRPDYHGEPLLEDTAWLLAQAESKNTAGGV